MAKLRERVKVWARVALGALVQFEDKRVPLERRLALDWRKRRAEYRRMLEETADIGEAASGLARALAEARVLAIQAERDLDTRLQAAAAAERRGELQEATRQQQAAAALADSLAQAVRNVQDVERLVDEALQNDERARRMVLDQAVRLAQLAGTDAQLVAVVQTNQMRAATLELQREARGSSSGEDFRGRALAAAEHLSDQLASREEITGGTWSSDRPATAAGAAQLARAKARLGLSAPASGEPPAGSPGGQDAERS